jgi:hypothetical protein
MTGSTKILTVSYGTFSCTLEGFDDPFATMRGIAEYFRDLAADDRYFGAEPPTPDVEMLQNIAQKEVRRRVEAQVGDTGVSLRQVTAAPASIKDAPAEPETAELATDEPDVRDTDALDHGPLAVDDDYLLSDEPEDVLAVDPQAVPPGTGPAETVAEKLRRIRAVVSRSIEPVESEDEPLFSAEQAPVADHPNPAPRRERALTETIAQITADLAGDESDEEPVSDEAPTQAKPGFESEVDAGSDNAMASELFADDDDDDDSEESGAGFFAESETLDEDGDDEDWNWMKDEDSSPSWSDSLEPEVSETKSAPGTSPEDAVASVLASETAAQEPVAETADVEAENVPEADAEENDVLRLDPADQAEAGDEIASETERKASKPLVPLSESNGDVGRLLAETDNQLQDGEGIRRRRVISQMRAAVAATKADRLISRRFFSKSVEEKSEETPYRQDFTQAVREVSRPLTAEPVRKPTTPLVLVSSQRIDVEAVIEKSQQASVAKPAATEGFALFAETMGATELPDLMEAAAAYSAFVEGQTTFSRPEIMKRVARVDPALNLSREEGLRSFGQLLRQGKLQKLERGQFTISKSTRFNPEQRYAGE